MTSEEDKLIQFPDSSNRTSKITRKLMRILMIPIMKKVCSALESRVQASKLIKYRVQTYKTRRKVGRAQIAEETLRLSLNYLIQSNRITILLLLRRIYRLKSKILIQTKSKTRIKRVKKQR